MLIVNADDYGRSDPASDAILECFDHHRISSTSAMVYMQGSARAASKAQGRGLDIGLHLNFSESFTDPSAPEPLRASQDRVRRFLKSSKFTLVLYHPLLNADFRALVEGQMAEFKRLYGQEPSHIDGHQHLHLCTNLLLRPCIPPSTKVRRSFSFQAREKGWLNRRYRAWVDGRLAARYQITDYFFDISQHSSPDQLHRIAQLAKSHSIEMMTHPERPGERSLLLSTAYAEALNGTPLQGYAALGSGPRSQKEPSSHRLTGTHD